MIFDLPVDFVSSSTAYIGGLVGDLAPVLMLLFGVMLGMWIIRFIMGLVSRKAK